MTTENFLVNNSCDGQTVKAICKCFPQFDIVASLAFIKETCFKNKQTNKTNRKCKYLPTIDIDVNIDIDIDTKIKQLLFYHKFD